MIYDPKDLDQMVKTIKKSKASTTQEGQEKRESPNTDMEELVRGAKIGAQKLREQDQKRLEEEAKAKKAMADLNRTMAEGHSNLMQTFSHPDDGADRLQYAMSPKSLPTAEDNISRVLSTNMWLPYDIEEIKYQTWNAQRPLEERYDADTASKLRSFIDGNMGLIKEDYAALERNAKKMEEQYAHDMTMYETDVTYNTDIHGMPIQKIHNREKPQKPVYAVSKYGREGYANLPKMVMDHASKMAKEFKVSYPEVTSSEDELAIAIANELYRQMHDYLIENDPKYQEGAIEHIYGMPYEAYLRKEVSKVKSKLGKMADKAAAKAVEARQNGEWWEKFSTPQGWSDYVAWKKKPYEDLIEKITAWEDNDFASGFDDAFDWQSFFTLGINDIATDANVLRILNKVESGEPLDDVDKDVYELWALSQELESLKENGLYGETALTSMLGSGLGETAEVLPSFFLSRGAVGSIGKGIQFGSKQAVKRYLANKTIGNGLRLMGTAAWDTAKFTGRSYLQGIAAAPISPMFYQNVLNEYNSQYKIGEDGNLAYKPKSHATMWLGALVDTANEYASEEFGVVFGEFAGLGLRGLGRAIGINKVANKSVAGVTLRRAAQKPLSETTKKYLRQAGFSGNLTGEWTGEMFGDLMSQTQRYMVGAEYDFEHFKDFDAWLTTIGVSAIFGSAMTTLGGGMTIYQETKYAKDIAQNRERIINNKIQDAALRDKLLMLSEVDDPMLAASELADYFNTHDIENASDKAYALDYITLNSQLKVLMGDVQEQERMVKFEAKRAEIEGKAYHGADGKSTRNVITVRDTEGNAYYVLKGDMANKEAMLELMDVNTGEMTTKVASAVTKPEYASVDSLLINAYGNMFSLEEEVSRVKDVTGALSSVEKPTMEHVETTAMQLDITLPKKGDVVTMVDGKTAEITEDLGDGTYIAQRKASLTGENETITLPFDAIRSNDSLTAKAQEAILNSGVESAVDATSTPQTTTEVHTPVESATPQPTTQTTSGVSVGAVIVAPNGEQARVVEINDDGTVALNYNLNEGASMADAAIEVVRMDDLTKADGSDASANVPTTAQVEMPTPAVPQPVAETPTTDAVDAAQNVEVVPTQKDGTVDFDAIEDPAQCAQMMAAMLGGPENALAIVEESIEAVKAEMDKAVKAKAPTINEGVAKQNKISEIKARLIRYEQIAFELEQMMKPAEAKAESVEHEAGLVENEHTAGLPEGMRKSIDEMAKRAKVRIEFVNERIKGDAEQKGNLIRVSTRNRTKAVEVLVGHELLHYMKSKMPEAYKAFKEAVIAFIGEDKFAKEVERRKKAYAAQNVKLNDEDAAEEIVADYAGYLVQGRDVFEKFIEPKKSDNVFLRGLKKGLEYIRNIFGANGMTKQVKAVDNMVDALNTLINATVEGKDIEEREETTAETTKGEEAKGEDGETKTKHSLKAQPSLVGVHNISLDKLRKVIKMGGLANPSVAVIDVDKQTHDDYGEYSLILPKNMVDARQGKNAGTWAGDAWTPTYPPIVKRMTDDKAISRFYKDIDALPEAMRNRVRLDFDSFMDGRDVGSLAYWYLYEKGVNPALVAVPSRYSDEVINALSEATNGTFNLYNLTPEALAKCLEVYIKTEHNGDKAAYEAKIQERKERLMEKDEAKVPDRVRKWAEDKVSELNEYGFDYGEVLNFVRDVESDVRKRGTVDVEATIRTAKDQIKVEKLDADYDTWLENLDVRYGIKEYIFNGYTYNGDRKYLPHTVENASKWMKKQGREGAVATFPSFGVFIANAIPKMTTLESIRKRKALLGKSNEEFEAFKDKWLKVYHELGNKLQPDAKGFDDYGYWRLIEAVGKNNPKEFIKKEYGIELSEEDMTKFNDMVNAIRTEYPARYFETKFERPLQLSDFTAAVVPNDIPLDVESRLKDANVEVIEYEKGDNASRAEAMQKASAMENVRFSLMDDAQAAAEVVPYLEAYNTDLTTFNALVNKVKDVAEKYPNATWPERFLEENYEDENEDDFINRLKWTISNYAIEEEKDYSEEKQTIEETFGGIWIEDTGEFAKFVSAVKNSPFEEDGEGIAYTDNYFYAYYRNINGEPVPYASVYMNEHESQDVVNQVNKELGNVRKGERAKFYFDRVAIRVGALQSENNANNGSNQNAPRSVGNSGVVQGLLRKGRYYDNPSLYVKTSRTDGRGDVDYHYSLRETDPEILEQLNNGNTIKVYRAMQVIDGELYPPMSARVGGKLRAPIALGEWERAEERPDLADDKGYFKLDKGNSTSLKARYNPYIHTSLTPLNDQFSSAQDRPNLVTVEVEIPESELTSGYKADKAKDAVGKLEWKAGVVQSQLTGTRTVILSRWDRPIRIVPDSEVAQRIVEMFGDTKVIMPSNVVTPSLREELEKLGVPFRETDNQGKSRYSLITPEMDASYLDAVERGDMETAQKMVMEAAKLAMPNTKVVDEDGNPKVVYHGTPNNFNAFSKEMFGTSTDRGIWGNGFYFSDSEQYAKTYEKRGDKQGRTLTVFLNIENPLFISLRNGGNEGAMYFHELMEKHFTDDIYEDATRTDELMSVAQERLTADIVAKGYDGIVVEYTNHIDTEYVTFEPSQIKSADPVTYDDNGNVIPLSERFNPKKEDIRYSLIGEKGAAMLDQADESMRRLEDLETARQMERAGKKATDIKLATGWERGADNLWRYEVDDYFEMFDSQGDINGEKKGDSGELQDYLDHEELYNAYPELRKIKVEVVEPSKIEGYNGLYYKDANKIVLARRPHEGMVRTLFHEVQHAIQAIEGFAEGGNPNMTDPIKSNNILHRIEKLQKEVEAKEKARNDLMEQRDAVSDKMAAWFDAHEDVTMVSEWDNEMRSYDREYDKLRKQVATVQREIDKANNTIAALEKRDPKLGKDGYRRLAGEVEARSTAARVGMIWAERLNSLASEMEDIAPKDQIFLKDGIAYATEALEEATHYSLPEAAETSATRYALSDIPFFDAEGKAIDMSAISEAKALEMIDGRVRDMMAYDYDKSVIDIANQAKRDRRATRAYYAEERRKRRGGNEAPRTNAAKIDELFADTNINSLPLEVQALIFIAEGRAKIRWADKDGKRGLASELGLANSASDKAAMKSVWSGAEQSFDEVVHGWWESINGYERGIDTQDLRNALIDALMSFPSAKAAMRELQTQYDAIATAEREALEEIDRREAADLDRVKREYEERSARFEMSEGDERESMREMAVEHYSSQPLSAADEALEELTDKLNKMERRAERLLLDQKSGYRELAESIEKSKEVIIRTLEHLRMFSGMEQIHIDEVAKLIAMTRTARSKRQVEAVATKAKNLIQRIAIRKARENMRRLLDLKLSNVEVIQQILKESNTLPREERDALLKSLWKVSRNGWRATKAVHPDTKEIFKELNDLIKEYKKSVKDKEVATIKQTITDRLVSLEAELHPDVEVDDKGNVEDNAGLPVDFNDNNKNIALLLFKSYLEVEAKNVAYSEANKTLRETAKGSDDYGAAVANMYASRDAYLSAVKQFNATLEDVIVNGKDKLRDFNIEKEKHEIALRSMAINAIGGKKASGQGKRANALQLARAAYNISVNSPYWTFETVLERIDRLSPYKKGEFYNYFMRKYTDANAKLYTSYTAHMESIGSAMARCFPDMAKQFGIIGRNPYEIYKAVMRKAEATALGTLKYKEGDVEREMQLTVANAMYIVAMWRQPRYREAMEANGITEGAINNLMQSINKEHAGYIKFMDWVNEALLPNTRLEYDEVYRKLNGGSLAKEGNYFPARVVTHEDVKLDKNGKGQLPSSPSALKERISHKTMPKMGTDYFKVLEAHIQDMDKWAAFAELTADLNVILSSDEFRRRLNEFMPGVGGDGGGKGSLYKMLYDTALIATGNYHNSGENVFGPIQKAWATSNIAFRLWTAVKQISSVTVGATEHVYFFKHMAATATVAGIAYEWKRAMELSPSLRYRWQSKAAGMEALMRETSRGDGYAHYRGGVVKTYDALKDMADKAVKLGMTPNALVDAIACSILVNSVYDKAIHDMTKGEREATEEERKEAIRKAEIAFNSTQQSSEGAYLSAAQANPLYAPLTTYMNASYALHRKRMSGIHELWKLMTSKEYSRFLKDEYGVDAAKISAKDAFADIIRGIVGDLSFASMGWGLMEVMAAVYEWLGGDGDDDDTEAEKQAFFETYWLPVFNGFLGGSQITSLFQGYDTSMTPAYDELLEDVRGIFDDKGDWRVEVAQAATKYGLGIDIKSLYRIGAGLENMVAEENGENAGSILMSLNAPNKYIKAFVGDRREGETLQQYQTRIMRLYTLFDKVMYEELYDENGKYIGEGAPSMIMSQTQAKDLNKEYEAAYLKDVVVRNGGWDEYRTLMSKEMLYKDICAFIGVTPDAQPSKAKLRNTVYSTGEYVAPVYGLSQKEHGELLSAESYVAGAHYYRTRWVGDDEGYYGLLKEEYKKKSELIDKYNEYIK